MADNTSDLSSNREGPHREHAHHQAFIRGDYGGNPLAHMMTNDSGSASVYGAFGGAFEPGLYKKSPYKFANPVPLGLSGFALTTFVLSLINLGTLDLTSPSIVIGPALAYGGFIQLLAGMWDIALGNTFGGTALSSYGGFWIGLAIILTPGGFRIESTYAQEQDLGQFYAALGLYIMGWFIFTFLLWLCTLKSTLAFNSLLLTVWIAFICLGAAYMDARNNAEFAPNTGLLRAGGAFGIVAAFLAWYNMYAGIADPSNTFFIVPVVHFPWSEKGRERRGKLDNPNTV
ncbi:hypothetical protein K431DRAFT_306088 [Polychaeton citri CBS 116435]|uniref:Uncharacterized protein n=1 Tax=Polychaeton citri CBS 116435 TaxID=1314669 RepID=A0A9P4Q0N0_9PEZI|nr:hypothetical protein K431DRAFT_306088 [Polychaeton citri CBS 116435]